MKRNLLTSFVILICSFSLWGQDCVEQAFGFGNNQFISSYNISGDVEVVFDAANAMVTLNLGSNYSTAFGPDVRAYLVKSNGLTDDELSRTRIADLENVQFGLTTASGAQTYTIDAPADIQEFDKVFFYCLNFDQFWDFGTIDSFPAEGCIVSSVRDNIGTEAIDLYPNPASQSVKVQISSNSDIVGQVTIYDVLGKRLFTTVGNINQNLDVSSLNTGIYSMLVEYDGKIQTKKLIISK